MSTDVPVGSKRPLGQNNSDWPRKKQPIEADEDAMDEDFGIESLDDDVLEEPDQLEFNDDILVEAGKNWKRPESPKLTPETDPLIFQQFEVDYSSGKPNTRYYKSDLQEAPVLRMFGVNENGECYLLLPSSINCIWAPNRQAVVEDNDIHDFSCFVGNSVCVFVHGFEPYFYVEAPTSNFSPDDCVSLADTLNVRA